MNLINICVYMCIINSSLSIEINKLRFDIDRSKRETIEYFKLAIVKKITFLNSTTM